MNWDDLGQTVLLIFVVSFAVVGLLAVAALIYVIVRFRPSFGAIAAAVGALIYAGSPIDLVPEAIVGPLGTLDDVGVLIAAAAFMVTQIRKGRGAVRGRRRNVDGSNGDGSNGDGSNGDGPVIVKQLPDD